MYIYNHKWGVNLNVMFGGAEVKRNKPQPLMADLAGNVKQLLSNGQHFPIRNIQPVPLQYMINPCYSQKNSESRMI